MNRFKILVFFLILLISIPVNQGKEVIENNSLKVQLKSSSPDKVTFTITGAIPFDFSASQKTNILTILIPHVSKLDSSSLLKDSKINQYTAKVDHTNQAKLSFILTDYPYHYLRYYFSYKTLIVELNKYPLKRLYKKLIVVDPGHGAYSDDKELWDYYDCGAIGSTGVFESSINLKIAKLVRNMLVEYGAQVVMTRETENERNSLRFEQRGNLVNDVLPDIYLSIHQNTSIDKSAHGSVLYYSNPVAYKLVSSISKEMLKNTSIPLRSLFNGKFEMIERMNIEAKVLIECAFLSNPAEEKYLIQEENQEKIASAIVTGIINFFENQ